MNIDVLDVECAIYGETSEVYCPYISGYEYPTLHIVEKYCTDPFLYYDYYCILMLSVVECAVYGETSEVYCPYISGYEYPTLHIVQKNCTDPFVYYEGCRQADTDSYDQKALFGK